MPILANDERVLAWLEAMGVDTSGLERIILDIQVNEVVRLYLVRLPDDRMFDVHFEPGSVEIMSVPKQAVEVDPEENDAH